MFKVGDLVIGHDSENQEASVPYDGRIGKIVHIWYRPEHDTNVNNKDHARIDYSDNDYWYYDLDELTPAKPYIINTILNEI
jgi:hypothetical protein